MTTEESLTTSQLRQLLIALSEHASHTCVRVRLVGQMWGTQFMRVVSVSEDRALFNDETNNKLISIALNNVMQVEIDHKYRDFQPHNHYTIRME